MKKRVIFFGTPEYVLPVLKVLFRNYEVVGVVTQEPKPAGRGRDVGRSAVDDYVFRKYQRRIPVLYSMKELPEAEFGVVAAYGKIIPRRVIDHFEDGMFNVHPSLLPKYRGATPVPAAIMAGESETGVSVMLMDEKMDHGDVISQFKEKIDPDETAYELLVRLFERSAEFLIELLPGYFEGKIVGKQQDHSKATFTKLHTKSDGYVEGKALLSAFEGGGTEIHNRVRGLSPWPGVWTKVTIKGEGVRMRVLRTRLIEKKLKIVEVQLEGKNPVSWEQFKEGYPNFEFADS